MPRLIAIDWETYLISNEQPCPKPVCLSWYDGENSGLKVGMEQMEGYLSKVMNRGEILIAHNVTFEARVIYTYFPRLRPLVWHYLKNNMFICTKIYEKLINNIRKTPINKSDLASLVLKYFGTDISHTKTDPEAWRLRYSELDGVELKDWPQAAIDYAIDDSIWTYKLYNMQKQYDLNYGPSVMAEVCLNLMADTGILVDLERVSHLEQEIDEFLQPRYDLLVSKGFMSIVKKTGKYKKNTKVFKEHIKSLVKEPKKTQKNGIATDGLALQEYLNETNDEIIQAFLDIAVYEKVKSAFIVNLKQANPVMRTQYNAVVSSGRTSSSKSLAFPSMNMQQMPREVPNVTYDIRNCFIPRPGFKIVSIDYSGLELAATGHQLYSTFGWSKMRDTINMGDVPVDMHSRFACQLKSIAERKECTYQEFVANKKLPGYKEFRQRAKPINLGFPGGIGFDTMRFLMSRDGIQTDYKVYFKSGDEGKIDRLLQKYKQKYPNIRKQRTGFAEWALVYDELVGLKRALFDLYPELEYFLKTKHHEFLTGEKMRMKNEYGEWESEPVYAFETHGVKRDYCTYTALCNNYLMQTPAAVGAKKTQCLLTEKYHEDPDMNLLAMIHDEWIFEVREGPRMWDIIDDVAKIMVDGMQSVLTSVRIAVEADVMSYWSKEGEGVCKTYWKNYGDGKLYEKV